MLPEEPTTLQSAGLGVDLVVQLLLKHLHFAGELAGTELSARIGLTFAAIEPAVELLKRQRHCEIAGGAAFGAASYRYRITDAGRVRASLFLEQNQYVGADPVPIEQYRAYMRRLHEVAPVRVTRERVRDVFAHLVVRDSLIDQIGPAVNGGHSLFLYGPAGNGKTVVAQAIRGLLTGDIAIPYALDVEGSIVRVFDPVNHQALAVEAGSGLTTAGDGHDRRWVRCRRPLVMVGGELTLDALDLRFSAAGGFYRAPIQVAANGGILVIDDFGRQRCAPRDLLNRWIVPLESRIDFLTLQTGQTFELPFMAFLVFATNLQPSELADEAFLRRIGYKVFADNPSPDEFARIFESCCDSTGVPFQRALVDGLLRDYYAPRRIELRACQPRDLIAHALALADYRNEPRRLTPALLEAACDSYFVTDVTTAA